MKSCLPILVFLFASIATAQSDTINHDDLARRLLNDSQTSGRLFYIIDEEYRREVEQATGKPLPGQANQKKKPTK